MVSPWVCNMLNMIPLNMIPTLLYDLQIGLSCHFRLPGRTLELHCFRPHLRGPHVGRCCPAARKAEAEADVITASGRARSGGVAG